MRERPILFSGPMVRAILDGRKTQTRRVAKYDHFIPKRMQDDYDFDTFIRINPAYFAPDILGEYGPFGKVGDRLWVRETHLLDPPDDGTWPFYDYTDGEHYNVKAIPERFRTQNHVIYRESWTSSDLRWRPSIFMPRWASRITLEITNVRVERLQAITVNDVMAEGVEIHPPAIGHAQQGIERTFGKLWDKINGKTHPWSENCWVWVIEFKRI